VAGESDDLKNTLFLPRNFSVTTAERLRALVAGPPAFALRRRKIEDLEASILRGMRAHEEATGAPIDSGSPPRPLVRAVALLQKLVEAHNRYYPIEASLPVDLATGEFVDRGKRWQPMTLPTLETLLARRRADDRAE
jgi:hypothetical protein